MQPKDIALSIEKPLEGMKIAHDFVSRTLGPNGSNVILDRGFSAPIITNDGVSILEALDHDDFQVRQGIELLKDAAKKQREYAGDGTTTFTVLSYEAALLASSAKDKMQTKREMENAAQEVIARLRAAARPIETDDEIRSVAFAATESDEMADIIFDTIKTVGNDAIISVEQSKERATRVTIADGYVVERGYSNGAAGTAEMNETNILTFGDPIESIHNLTPLFEKCSKAGIVDMVLFAPKVDQSVLNALGDFWKRNILRVIVIEVNTKNQEVIHDIALLTNADFISKDRGFNYAKLSIDQIGHSSKIIITASQTTIIGGKGNIKPTVEGLREMLAKEKDPDAYDLIEKRIARLTNTSATITIGSPTEDNAQYVFYKMMNGVNSTHAAIQEGIVRGGGVELHDIANTMSADTVGAKIVQQAIRAPMRLILENGGNVYTGNTIETTAIDPVKVTRFAVENAISLASTFITSHGVIALRRKLEV